jgi:hypothetical protein
MQVKLHLCRKKSLNVRLEGVLTVLLLNLFRIIYNNSSSYLTGSTLRLRYKIPVFGNSLLLRTIGKKYRSRTVGVFNLDELNNMS